MEVGGAYAQLFIPLLEFLGLRSLIVTDLDAVKKNEKNKLEACLVHEGESTSNSCIKSWFAEVARPAEAEKVEERQAEPAVEAAAEAVVDLADDDEEEVKEGTTLFDLAVAMTADAAKKTRGTLRIAYQVPEADGGPCGRTFEDAFILANQGLFGITGTTNDALAKAAADKAAKQKKSKFALTYAIYKTNWTTPRYIKDGIVWLADSNAAVVDPGVALAA